MQCPHCKKDVPPGYPRCIYCGSDFSVPRSNKSPTPPQISASPANPQNTYRKIALRSGLWRLAGPLCLILFLTIAGWLSRCQKEPVPVPYSTNSQNKDLVYVDVVSIYPSYSISLTTGSNSYVNRIVCRCKCADGQTVYMSVYVHDYEESFDPDANPDDFIMRDLIYDTPVRIIGKLTETEIISEELPSQIKDPYVILFERIEE